MIRRLGKRVEWLRQSRALRDVGTMEEFREYVARTRPGEFLTYEAKSAQKRVEAESLLSHIGLSLAGKRALDLGPGHGDSLDVFRDDGAESCVFAERDVIFYAYNRLKGFDGHRCNFLRDLDRLSDRRYDFVYVGHSVSYRNFRLGRERSFSRWLRQLQGLVPADGSIVISPWWPPGTSGMTREDLVEHWFGQALLERNFEPLPWIEGHNREVAYPITFLAPGERRPG